MTIDPNIKLKNLAGEPLTDGKEEVTLGKSLGGILLSGSEGGKMKLFVLAQKLYNATEPIELDQSDFNLVSTCVKNIDSRVSPAIVSGQVELLLSECK